MNQLKCDFRSTSVNVLRRVFRDHRFHYVPSYYELMRSPEMHSLKTKRSLRECQRHKTTDLQLLQEVRTCCLPRCALINSRPDLLLHRYPVGVHQKRGADLRVPQEQGTATSRGSESSAIQQYAAGVPDLLRE